MYSLSESLINLSNNTRACIYCNYNCLSNILCKEIKFTFIKLLQIFSRVDMLQIIYLERPCSISYCPLNKLIRDLPRGVLVEYGIHQGNFSCTTPCLSFCWTVLKNGKAQSIFLMKQNKHLNRTALCYQTKNKKTLYNVLAEALTFQ